MGAYFVVPDSILGDCIDYDEFHMGKRSESGYTVIETNLQQVSRSGLVLMSQLTPTPPSAAPPSGRPLIAAPFCAVVLLGPAVHGGSFLRTALHHRRAGWIPLKRRLRLRMRLRRGGLRVRPADHGGPGR